MQSDSREALWANLTTLMQQRWGGENLNQLGRIAGVSPGTASRLKARQTSVGLETLDKLADGFGVPAHELLDPAFNPQPNRAEPLSPLALDLARQLDAIRDPARQSKAFALASAVLQLGIAPADLEPAAQPSTDRAAQPSPEGEHAPKPGPHPQR